MGDNMRNEKVKNIMASVNSILKGDEILEAFRALDLALTGIGCVIEESGLAQFIRTEMANESNSSEGDYISEADNSVMVILTIIVLSSLSSSFSKCLLGDITVEGFCESVALAQSTSARALAEALGDTSNASQMVLHTVDANAERISNIIELNRNRINDQTN